MPRSGEKEIVVAERGGGFVEDEQVGVAAEGFGDLDQLLLPDAQMRHRGAGIQRQAQRAWA